MASSRPSSPPAPGGRPRTVDAAFYCWMAGGAVTGAMGLLMLTYPVAAYKLVGALLLAAGLALGFLAGRARRGDARFARASLALAMAVVAFLALVALFLPVPIGVLVLIAVTLAVLIAGSFLNQRPASQRWFYPEGRK